MMEWGSYGHYAHKGECAEVARKNWDMLLRFYGYWDKDGNHSKNYSKAYDKAYAFKTAFEKQWLKEQNAILKARQAQ